MVIEYSSALGAGSKQIETL